MLSYNAVARKLKIHHTTVLYWLGRLKKKPSKPLEEFKILPKDYDNIINKVDADIENPIEFGRKLRQDFKKDFNLYPEELKLD